MRCSLTRVFVLVGVALLYAMPAASQDDRIARLISILEKKGITFTEEELESLAADPAVDRVGVDSVALDRAVTEALERKAEERLAIEIPGVKRLRVRLHNRVRYEYYNNVYSPMDPRGRDDFDLVRMRNRLRFDFDLTEGITAIFEAQDVRIWGSEGSTTAVTGGVDLKRGEVILRDVFDAPVDLEVGRFVLVYGDQRLIGGLEWFDQGRTYDGFRVHIHPGEWFVDLFATRIRETVLTNDDQDLFGVYAGTNRKEGLNIEGYLLGFRDQLELMGERGLGHTLYATVGTRVHGRSGGFDYGAELAYQFGEVRGDDLSAYAVSAHAGWTADCDAKPRIGVEVNYASGNENASDGDTEQFQVLFPTNHLHYGYADLAAWSNLFNIRVAGSIQPHDAVSVSLDYHYLRLADADGGWINAGGGLIRPGTSGNDRHLGDEVDLTVTWRPYEHLTVLAGWSHFFAGGFVRDTGGGGDLDFVYLQSFLSF